MAHAQTFRMQAPAQTSAGKKSAPARAQSGKTPLQIAAYRDDPVTVDALVRAGANVNIRDETGDTLIHRAIREGQYLVFDALMRGNPDLNIRGQLGYTMLDLATKFCRHNMVKALKDAGATA